MKKVKWLVAAVAISFGSQVMAATIAWTNVGTGDWITPANWAGGALPVSPDDARITNGGIAVIESAQEVSTGSITVGDILGTTGSLRVLGGKLSTLNSDIRIGGNNANPTGATGTFDQSGGIVAMSFANFNLGFGTNSHGTYNLSGGAFYLNTAGATVVIAVGNRGFGSINQSGGEIFIKAANGFTQLGRNVAAGSGFGTYNLSGGSLAAGRLIFGDAVGTGPVSTNIFNLSGTGVVRTGTFYVKNTTASNSFNFTGGTLLTTNIGFPVRNSGGILNPTFFDFGNAGATNTETMVSNSIATLTITNTPTSYIQDPGGTLVIDIAAAGNNDMLNLGVGATVGDVTLGGQIVVNLLNGYDPPLNTVFDIVVADSITNNAAISGRTPSGLSFLPQIEFGGDDRAILRLYVIETQPAPVLTNPVILGNGSFQFTFTNATGYNFTALSSTNIALPSLYWDVLGPVPEASPGVYQFTVPDATNGPTRFYQVRFP